MTDYKHSPKWRHEEEEHPGNVLVTITLIIIGIIMGAVTVLAGQAIYSAFKPAPKAGMDCRTCHGRIQAYTEYFRKSGSKHPEKMAAAVLSTRNPALMSAIAKVETAGNPEIRRSGYRKQHDGAFQVNGKYWGKVPHNAVDQALQAEAILDELTATMPLKKALSYYGGDTTDRYSRRVLAALQEAPK